MLAPRAPVIVAGDADKHLLAVAGLEGLVDRPGAGAGRHGLRFAPRRADAGHVLRHEEGRRLEQRRLHELPPAGRLTLLQRAEDADDRIAAAHDVDDRGAGAQRPAGRAGHVGKPGHELHHLVERGPVLIGPGEEALERGEDEARVDPAQRLPAAAEPLHGAGGVILDHHIGLRGEPVDDLPAAVRLEIDGQRTLVAVEAAEEAGGETRQAAGLVAVGRGLDLDDVRAEVGEHQAAARPHDRLAELQHPDAGERERGVFGHRSRNLCFGESMRRLWAIPAPAATGTVCPAAMQFS